MLLSPKKNILPHRIIDTLKLRIGIGNSRMNRKGTG